jgi:hypothetical protein
MQEIAMRLGTATTFNMRYNNAEERQTLQSVFEEAGAKNISWSFADEGFVNLDLDTAGQVSAVLRGLQNRGYQNQSFQLRPGSKGIGGGVGHCG